MLANGELLSCSSDNTIKVWDLNKEGCCIKTLVANNKEFFLSFKINRQNTALVSCSTRGIIQIWDLNRLNCAETIQVEKYIRDFICIPGPVDLSRIRCRKRKFDWHCTLA